MKLTITRVFTFDAAHRIVGHPGRCANLHGHTYRLEITVRGNINESGMVVDFQTLKTVVMERFIGPYLDHHDLNISLPVNPTAENLVVWFFDTWDQEVAPVLGDVELERVLLWETPDSCVSLTRQDWEEGRRAI